MNMPMTLAVGVALRAARQHGAEHDVVASAAAPDDQRPRDMEQHRRADAAAQCRSADALPEPRIERHARLAVAVGGAAHVGEPERQRRLGVVGEQGAEVRLVRGGGRIAQLRDEVAVPCRRLEPVAAALEHGLDLAEQDLFRDVIDDDVVHDQ
jgi:hypothetical protein